MSTEPRHAASSKIVIKPEDLTQPPPPPAVPSSLPPSATTPPDPEKKKDSLSEIVSFVVFAGLFFLFVWFKSPSTNPKGKATLAFWNQIAAIQNELSAGQKTGSPARGRALATRIASLPTKDVDPEAVNFSLECAQTLRRLADASEQVNDPDLMFMAVLRGMAGDPFGVANDVRAVRQSVAADLERLNRLEISTRASLTARHGVEFPALFR